ncbi:MAG: biotin--[acetyl-CoA-carboxylase] ligase [Lachnospiraceae bacterium]|nr:biotin--[acetyl-CoA-carboxylase] ligase [Lachnospiraceae bacterium]
MSYSTKDQVLALLFRAGGNFISGEDASKSMGLSRAAVSTAVRGLREEGYAIESVTNRGYKLITLPDTITTGTLLAGLSAKRMDRVICLPVTTSTNSCLMELAQKNAPDGQVVIAEMQTEGRARTGKHFSSPKGLGIYLSYLIRPDVAGGESAFVKDWSFITKRIGMTVSDVIKDICGISVKIRENELLVNGRKLCGILTQTDMEVESGMIRSLIAGIGINVHRTEGNPGTGDGMTSLDTETGRSNNRPVIACALIDALDDLRTSLSC